MCTNYCRDITLLSYLFSGNCGLQYWDFFTNFTVNVHLKFLHTQFLQVEYLENWLNLPLQTSEQNRGAALLNALFF